jgi:hypothetical protein
MNSPSVMSKPAIRLPAFFHSPLVRPHYISESVLAGQRPRRGTRCVVKDKNLQRPIPIEFSNMAERVGKNDRILATGWQEHIDARKLLTRSAPLLDLNDVPLKSHAVASHPQPKIDERRRNRDRKKHQAKSSVWRVEHHLGERVDEAGLRREQPHERPPTLDAEVAVLLAIGRR